MKFEEICRLFDEINSTSKTNNKISSIVDFFDYNDDNINLEFLKIFDFNKSKLNFSKKMILNTLAYLLNYKVFQVEKDFRDIGDIGLLAEKYVNNIPQGLITRNTKMKFSDLFLYLNELANINSTNKKINYLKNCLYNISGIHAKYLVKIICNDLNIGIKKPTLLKVISKYTEYEEKIIKDIFNSNNSLEKTLKQILDGDLNISLNYFEPVKPMLYEKFENEFDIHNFINFSHDIDDLIYMYQYKYDGVRVQIHKNENNVKIFTRNLKDVTNNLPDIVELLQQNFKNINFICDAEIIGEKNNEILDFQKVLTRVMRKHDLEKTIDKTPLTIKIFDVLKINDNDLINEKYNIRFNELKLKCNKNNFFAKTIYTDNSEEIEKFFTKAIEENNEGLMVKNPLSIYEINSRTKDIAKWKKQTDTIDCVVIAGERGDGKRTGFYKNLFIGLRADEEYIKLIGKVGSGFSDDDLIIFNKKLNKVQTNPKILMTSKEHQKIMFNDNIDVFEPKMIIEVEYGEIFEDKNGKKSLRFPVFKSIRYDKNINEIDTIEILK